MRWSQFYLVISPQTPWVCAIVFGWEIHSRFLPQGVSWVLYQAGHKASPELAVCWFLLLQCSLITYATAAAYYFSKFLAITRTEGFWNQCTYFISSHSWPINCVTFDWCSTLKLFCLTSKKFELCCFSGYWYWLQLEKYRLLNCRMYR